MTYKLITLLGAVTFIAFIFLVLWLAATIPTPVFSQQINQPPVVQGFTCPRTANLDLSALGGVMVDLGDTATATDDAPGLTFEWIFEVGPRPVEFLDRTQLNAFACFVYPGDYFFRFKVTDAEGLTDSDVIKITISAP